MLTFMQNMSHSYLFSILKVIFRIGKISLQQPIIYIKNYRLSLTNSISTGILYTLRKIMYPEALWKKTIMNYLK